MNEQNEKPEVMVIGKCGGHDCEIGEHIYKGQGIIGVIDDGKGQRGAVVMGMNRIEIAEAFKFLMEIIANEYKDIPIALALQEDGMSMLEALKLAQASSHVNHKN